jgi:pimeloyl-ACP methyl ester carboxylesterase
MSKLTHHFATLREVTMHYVTAGAGGTTLVLLHGYPQSWFCWRQVITELQNEYSLVAPDLRGLGDTTRPVSGYDKRTVAADVYELLSEHLGLSRYAVAGHDWGGAVAFALAADHPDAVTHLAVVDVAIPGDGQPDIGQAGRRWHHTFLEAPDLPEALIGGRPGAPVL